MNSNPSAFAVNARPGDLVRNQVAPQNPKYPSPILHHWVLQLNGVPTERIDDSERLELLLNQVVSALELTRVSSHSHYFGPGVSTVVILSESHLAAHSWPELGYLHIDIVTCAKGFEAVNLRSAFAGAFQPESLQLMQVHY